MKQSYQCPKCESRRIVHLQHVGDAAGARDDVHADFRGASRASYSARRHLAVELGIGEGGWFAPEKGEAYPAEMRCPTEAYACAQCGYFEEYIVDVEAVSWSKIYGASWCRPETPEQGPFRT